MQDPEEWLRGGFLQSETPKHMSKEVGMKVKRRGFSDNILAIIHQDKILGIRAGTEPHRFIGIWAVVVEKRVFVRSWSLRPRSWYRTFLEEPRGLIQVAGREFPVRAVHTRSERLKDAISRAYLEKYKTPGSIKYARDMGRAKSRATTTELVPLKVERGRSAEKGRTGLSKNR
jgi:hypothetical protein